MFDFNANYFGPDEKIMKYVNEYIKLQDMLLFMQHKEIPNVVERLLSSNFFIDEERIEELVHLVLASSEAKPKQIQVYADVLIGIFQATNRVDTDYVKQALIKETFSDDKAVRRRTNYLRIFRILITKKWFPIGLVISKIKEMKTGECFYTVLLYFLDMIPKDIFDELMKREFSDLRKDGCPALNFLKQRDQLEAKDYELYKQYIKFGCKTESLDFAIMTDNVELYKQYNRRRDMQRIGFHNDNPFKLYDYYSDLKLVFIVGAFKIAKHLYSPKQDLRFEKVALGASSSTEMVELWSKEPCEELIEGCAISHDWVFMEWLYDRCNNKLSGEHANELMLKSAVQNFPKGIMLAQSIDNFDLNEGDITGMNPLYWAIRNRNFAIAIMLASDPRIDIVLMRKDNNTLIHYAAKTNCTSLVRIMLQRGADPCYKNNHGNTPLHKAAKHGSLKVVKLMIEYKGDPKIVNKKKKTPADVASTDEIKEYLSSLE